jgi:hypothetical protein
MWPMKDLARTAHERRWIGAADSIARHGQRAPWLRWAWLPVWRWCYRRAYKPPTDTGSEGDAGEEAGLAREVGG